MAEDQIGQTGGNAFLVETAFRDGALMEGARVGCARQEGIAPEDQREHLEPVAALRFGEGEQAVVVAGKVEERSEFDLEELLRDRPRALVVEPPSRAVGENAPAEPARGHIVDASQVAQHLGRRGRLLAGSSGAAVERAQPALGLDHREPKLVALPLLGKAVGLALRRFVREQQAVRHVHPAVCAQVLLSQARRPPEPCEDGPDQIVLGLAFVGRCGGREAVADRAQRSLEVFKRRVVQFLPVG